MLVISLLCVIGCVIFNARKLKKGHSFSNTVKVMSFISDAHYYVPLKLCRMAKGIYVFKITGKLTFKHVKLDPIFCRIPWN